MWLCDATESCAACFFGVTHAFPHSDDLTFLHSLMIPGIPAILLVFFFLYSFGFYPRETIFCIPDGPLGSTPSVLTWSYLCSMSSLGFISYILDPLNQPTSFFTFSLFICLFSRQGFT